MEQKLLGTVFQNPVLLAAGTCGFGSEVWDVVDLDELGGIVTKSVTLEPRQGNPPPRVAEFRGGMVNSVGLANPGARTVRDERLPWLRDHLRRARVLVSVAGHTPGEFVDVIRVLDDADGFHAFELNLSCPNDSRRGGLPFALDPEAAARVVEGAREATQRPLVAKLAPNAPDLGPILQAVEEAGADAFTLVNTLPGLVLDPETGRPAVGAGAGGMSGPALRAVGVHAVWKARSRTRLPLLGVGGITAGPDAAQYLLAGASLVQVGSASFWDPRTAARVVNWLKGYVERRGNGDVSSLVGSARIAGSPSGATAVEHQGGHAGSAAIHPSPGPSADPVSGPVSPAGLDDPQS